MRTLPLAVSFAFLAFSALYLVQGARFPLGSVEQPGPGLFPILVGAFLVVSGFAFLLQCPRQIPATLALPAGEAGRRVTGIAAALAAFCLLLPWLGYGVTAFGLLLAILRLFGLTRWAVTTVVASVATAASYYLFAVVLGVPLPAGFWSY